MDIQWYPGHMARARRMVEKSLKLVDVAVELLDARVPASSRNPVLDEIIGNKPRVVVLNKSDLADPVYTEIWLDRLRSAGASAVAVSSTAGRGIDRVRREIKRLVEFRKLQTGAGRKTGPVRCMVMGIPNVGKSFFINRMVGRRAVPAADRPGVTRGQQWVKAGEGVEFLDTPGILWPKLGDPEVAFKLAVIGAVKEETFDLEEIALTLISWLNKYYPEVLSRRYRFSGSLLTPEQILGQIGEIRGFFGAGGEVDCLRASAHLLKEFRSGKLGRITLDLPDDEH